MTIRGSILYGLVLRAASPEVEYLAHELQARTERPIPATSLYPTCTRLVEHRYLAATGKHHRRRYRRTPRGTDYLRVLDIDLPVRLCRALGQVGEEPAPLSDVARTLLRPEINYRQAYAHLQQLSERQLVEVAGRWGSKTVTLTPLGAATLPNVAFVLQFWGEAS